MDQLRVLMFGWEYAPIASGGLGVVSRSIAQGLVRHGVHLTFVLPKLPQKFTVDYMDLINASEDVEIEDIDTISVPSTLMGPYMTEQEYKKIITSQKRKLTEENDAEIYGLNLFEEVSRYALRASKIAAEVEHDVIHAHDWMTFPAAVQAKNMSGKPLIVHIHATEHERSGGTPNMKIAEMERFGMEHADKVIAVSERTKEKIVQHYGIPTDRVVVVYNAVDEAKKEQPIALTTLPEKEYKMVLFLARLSPSKGADFLLKAAKLVLEKQKDVRFVFVGKGSMMDELIDMSIELGISENVLFTGFLNHDQVDLAYKQADLFVMPSVAEPFGITALEAIRNGTPVLMSKQSGASEVVQNALKVDFWDVSEMASKILAVLNHTTLAKALSTNGVVDLQRMSWDDQTAVLIDHYNSLR